MTSIAAALAPIVDRLVVSVHRQAAERRAEERQAWIESVGLERVGLIVNTRPFILAHRASEATALSLHRYQDPDLVLGAVAQAREMGLFDQDVFMATEAGHQAAQRLTDMQSGLMEELWAGHDDVIAAADPLVAHAIAHAAGHYDGPEFALFQDFASLPVPAEPAAYRLHHRLTVLRYLRSDIHAAAVAGAGLEPAEASAMTIVWKGQSYEPDPTGLRSVQERGLVNAAGDALTPEGLEMRQRIEDRTNESNEEAFEMMSPHDKTSLVDGLGSLPWE